MKYIRIPKEISFDSIMSNKACLAPSKYNDYYPNPTVDFRTLSTLVIPTSTKTRTFKSKTYRYIEIGDIDVNTGFVDSNTFFGYSLPSKNPVVIQQHDILISTVRTYRKGIGIVEIEGNNLVCSPAIFVIRDVEKTISKDYLLAILRSDFFIEQILSLQNRGMYPRLDGDTVRKVFIPVPNNRADLAYISALSKSVTNKYNLIYKRNKQLLDLVEEEIKQNQKPNSYSFSFPTITDVIDSGRMDAGFFSENHGQFIFETQNYRHGYHTLKEAGLTLIPGPSLEIKLLGTRIDSDKPSKGFYRLVTPTQFSDYGTISHYTYLGTPRKIEPIQYGDILFGESGTGRSVVYLERHDRTINNAHAHILRPDKVKCSLEKAITLRAILAYYKKIGVIDHLTVGGSGGHLSPSYFDRVIIPDFPEKQQKQIARLYHNPSVSYDISRITLDSFHEIDNSFDGEAGIVELDYAAKKITAQLDETIHKLVTGERIETSFSFLG